MSWTWTGYDHDAVHRFKETDFFFKPGRNVAEANFWKYQIHGVGDRRGTKSSISLGAGSEGYGSGQGRYSYSEPRERSNSVISTFSTRMKDFGPSRDYPYSYPGELSEEDPETEEKEEEVANEAPEVNDKEKEDDKKVEEQKVEDTKSDCCSCHDKEPTSDKQEDKKVEKDDENKKVAESTKIVEEKSVKSNPMKTLIETKKFVLDDHISSRFY